MSDIGLQAYRFSISWPRVLPDGTGKVNQRGLDFYSQLVDELLEKNISPWITLFHWDFPYALYCRGGWLNRDSADWFADYTALVVDKLSDRVSHWSTLNEPQCFIGFYKNIVAIVFIKTYIIITPETINFVSIYNIQIPVVI